MKDMGANLNNLRPTAAGVGGSAELSRGNLSRKTDSALFKEALAGTEKAPTDKAPVTILQPGALKFSNHALDRMQARQIRFSPTDMAKFEQAAAKAQAKGSRNCLLIHDQAAMIVDLKEKTVVTVMDKSNLKENVFTNIDATVMI